jgi:hypothetical protein
MPDVGSVAFGLMGRKFPEIALQILQLSPGKNTVWTQLPGFAGVFARFASIPGSQTVRGPHNPAV